MTKDRRRGFESLRGISHTAARSMRLPVRAPGALARWVALGVALWSLECGGGAASAPDGGNADSSTTNTRDARVDTGEASDARRDEGVATDARADTGDAAAKLKGAIQKGPFILGSSVQISAIDDAGSPTGTTFNTSTTDDPGDFTVSFAYRGYVDIQGSGFYYDEVTGALSAAPIVLHALYDVTTGGPQSAYVNIVTHLAHDRAVKLMAGGMTLAASEGQAESELVAALGIGGTAFAPGGVGVSLNELGTNDDSNAYLFAVSAIMVETVIQEGGTSSLDAQLQELIDTIASDLVAHGTLPGSVTSEILAAQEALDVDLTMDLFADRLKSIGSSATAANLDRAVDSDGDGDRNTVDTCPLVANPDQSVIPSGVLCAVTRHTTFLPQTWAATPIVADFENTGHAAAILQLFTGYALALGDGSGRFAAPVLLSLPSGFLPSLAYDINKDGKPDLVGWSVGATGWIPGDGAGHFGALVPFTSVDAGSPSLRGSRLGTSTAIRSRMSRGSGREGSSWSYSRRRRASSVRRSFRPLRLAATASLRTT
jgi:hypothetical protein